MTPAESLALGSAELALNLPSGAHEKLLAHLDLVEKWNRVYNLTAVRERERMIVQHVLDSLAIVPYLSGSRIADVGSGAGFPGIPLAIALPAASVVLYESSHKKATFLKQAVMELALANVTVEAERVERAPAVEPFDVIVSRAFSDLGEFVKLSGSRCAGNGMLVAMKGVYPHDEIAQVPAGFRLDAVHPVRVPALNGERHLVVLRRAA